MNITLLQQAIDYIETIPDNVFDLGQIHHQGDCGTICCAAGWLAHNSKFQALGLALTLPDTSSRFPYAAQLVLQGKAMYWDRAMADLFDMDREEAAALFGMRGDGPDGADEYAFGGTDRELWLQRAREYIAEHQVAA